MAFREDGPTVAVVGVTGAVGQEFLQVLSQRDFPYNSLKLLASRRSAGKQLPFQGKTYTVEELVPESFDGVDIALFSAGGGISREFGPIAMEKGAIVVDNSSAFRMDPTVPLVIPEVNPQAMSHITLKGRNGKGAIIANPNCSTIICLMGVTPLHRHAKVEFSIICFMVLMCFTALCTLYARSLSAKVIGARKMRSAFVIQIINNDNHK
jgi:aspartate-semialdehyde dehydrogenase